MERTVTFSCELGASWLSERVAVKYELNERPNLEGTQIKEVVDCKSQPHSHNLIKPPSRTNEKLFQN